MVLVCTHGTASVRLFLFYNCTNQAQEPIKARDRIVSHGQDNPFCSQQTKWLLEFKRTYSRNADTVASSTCLIIHVTDLLTPGLGLAHRQVAAQFVHIMIGLNCRRNSQKVFFVFILVCFITPKLSVILVPVGLFSFISTSFSGNARLLPQKRYNYYFYAEYTCPSVLRDVHTDKRFFQ